MYILVGGSGDAGYAQRDASGSPYYISEGGGGGGGSFVWEVQESPFPAIPEPSTWAMTLAGFAALGFAWRARAREGLFTKINDTILRANPTRPIW